MKTLENYFNEYNLKARVFPAIITSFPLLILQHFIFGKIFSFSIAAIVIGDVPLIVILIFLFIQINRFLSKKLFENKSDFTTDIALLPSSKVLSEEYRNNIALKVKEDFNLTMPQMHDESSDLAATKTRIREIVKCIINKVRDGHLVLQHNIEYGFVRNVIGGSVVALTVSLFNSALFIFIFPITSLAVVSLSLTVIYLIPVLCSSMLLRHYSDEYTDILFREYAK